MATKFSPNKEEDISISRKDHTRDNERLCPCCNKKTLKGMPGGKDAICSNCGYKDPCCYD